MTEHCPNAWQRLGAATLLIIFVWAVVLPRLGALPAIQRRAQLLEDKQIDAAALFYSDLECMAEVEKHMATIRAQHPNAFWPEPETPEHETRCQPDPTQR